MYDRFKHTERLRGYTSGVVSNRRRNRMLAIIGVIVLALGILIGGY